MSIPFTRIGWIPKEEDKEYIQYAAVSDGKKRTYYINGYEVSKEIYDEIWKTGVIK